MVTRSEQRRREGVSDTLELVVEAILVGNRDDSLVSERVPGADLDWGGMPGDRHHGVTLPSNNRDRGVYEPGTELRNRRQLTIVSVEECADMARRLGLDTLEPEWLGANLLVRGHPHLTSMPAGTRMVIPDGAALVCEGENLPCRFPGEVLQELFPHVDGMVKAFIREGYGRRGVAASVERVGPIRPGDRARVLPIPPTRTLT